MAADSTGTDGSGGPAAAASSEGGRGQRPGGTSSRRRRFQWFLFLAFAFIAFECVLLAIVLKGPWWILVAPGVVCAYKAHETWRELYPRAARPGRGSPGR